MRAVRWCGGIVSAIGAGDIQTCANEDAEPPLALCSGSTARRRQVHSAKVQHSSLDGGRPLLCRAQPALRRPSCTQQVAALHPASHHATGAQIGQLCGAVSVCYSMTASLHPPWRQCSEHSALAQSHGAQSNMGVVIWQWEVPHRYTGQRRSARSSQPARTRTCVTHGDDVVLLACGAGPKPWPSASPTCFWPCACCWSAVSRSAMQPTGETRMTAAPGQALPRGVGTRYSQPPQSHDILHVERYCNCVCVFFSGLYVQRLPALPTQVTVTRSIHPSIQVASSRLAQGVEKGHRGMDTNMATVHGAQYPPTHIHCHDWSPTHSLR